MLIRMSAFTSFGCQIKRKNYWIMRCRTFAKRNKPLLLALSRLRRLAGERGCRYIISEVAIPQGGLEILINQNDFTIRCARQSVQYNEGKSGNVLH